MPQQLSTAAGAGAPAAPAACSPPRGRSRTCAAAATYSNVLAAKSGPTGANWGQLGPTGANWGQLEPTGANRSQPEPTPAKQRQPEPAWPRPIAPHCETGIFRHRAATRRRPAPRTSRLLGAFLSPLEGGGMGRRPPPQHRRNFQKCNARNADSGNVRRARRTFVPPSPNPPPCFGMRPVTAGIAPVHRPGSCAGTTDATNDESGPIRERDSGVGWVVVRGARPRTATPAST